MGSSRFLGLLGRERGLVPNSKLMCPTSFPPLRTLAVPVPEMGSYSSDPSQVKLTPALVGFALT